MAGHSKWANIQHRKGRQDKKRGKLFSKLIREVTVAAKLGNDLSANPRLRAAIDKAKSQSMPKENIDRAILRGSGEEDGFNFEEVTYEGYGPAGVAVLIEAVTDNKNRTTPEIRHAFSKNGGNIGDTGCVAWMFDQKGLIVVNKEGQDEDEIMMMALEAGAEDIQDEGDTFDVFTSPSEFESVRSQLTESGIEPLRAEISRIPQSTVAIEGQKAEQLLRLLEVLEEHDDVQNVYANFDMDDKVLDEMNG